MVRGSVSKENEEALSPGGGTLVKALRFSPLRYALVTAVLSSIHYKRDYLVTSYFNMFWGRTTSVQIYKVLVRSSEQSRRSTAREQTEA